MHRNWQLMAERVVLDRYIEPACRCGGGDCYDEHEPAASEIVAAGVVICRATAGQFECCPEERVDEWMRCLIALDDEAVALADLARDILRAARAARYKAG